MINVLIYIESTPVSITRSRWTLRLRSDTEKKINQEFKKFVTRQGFEPATSCVAFGYSNYLAIDQKEKLIKNEKKN